jgi:hypothetical protein
MNVVIETQHMLRVHKDKALMEYLQHVPRAFGNYDDANRLFPKVSGRALRSLLLNAPMHVPELATPTFEAVAAQYTPMALHPVYHALVLGEQAAFDEFTKKIQSQFGFYRNRRIGMDLLLALLYLLVSMKHTWNLSTEQENTLNYLLSRVSDSIKHGTQALSGLEANLDPIRVVYIRSYRDGSKPDEVVAIADAKVYADYLAAGYTVEQLLERIAKRDTTSLFVRKV